jgi:hypothetical protein
LRWVFSVFFLASAGCSAPASDVNIQAEQLELVLPSRYSHWRHSFVQQWQDIENSQAESLKRWRKSREGSFKMVLLESPLVAQQYYSEHKLSGRSDTPRTFINERLALLVLPANDRLLAELPTPPQTILHDFRHEASHLISCDYPELLSSPNWFQEGWAEMWAPLNREDVSQWPHAHDLFRWYPSLNWSNLEQAPAEVRYSFMAHAAELCLRNSPSSQPWALKPAIDLPKSAKYHGLRGRHAYWDIDARHYLLSSMLNSQVDLDLPEQWDGESDLLLKVRVGATSSPVAGIVFYSALSDIDQADLLRIPVDVNGGINAYVDTVKHTLIRSLYPATDRQKFGAWREVTLRRSKSSIVVTSDDFEKIIPFAEYQLQFPLLMRMYARNGSFELKHEEILN